MPNRRPPCYITTPIYYVNDRPHIGHVYTTLLGDVLARYRRLCGDDVFFLTGTDEHADKVVDSAKAHGVTPLQWADRNAAAFKAAFHEMGFSNDDFIRTTEKRHTEKVVEYIGRLQATGDVFLGHYEGWWDASQEEYVTESTAREHGYKSPVTGRELVKRREQNYFFKLSAYGDRLREHIERNPGFIQPDARRNEILGRIREGLQDVPITRAVEDPTGEVWGIRMPGDAGHRVYVWIDALFNYLSAVDTEDRREFWSEMEGGNAPATHLMAKDIVWFHAVIWPSMLMALREPLPETVLAHSYWIREGRKMSKSLGNFLDLPTIRGYCAAYSRDALRWFLATQGPLGATDSDFAHARFVEVYNADLANGIGNAFSRVSNMIAKYFDGKVPDAKGVTSHAGHDWPALAREHVEQTKHFFAQHRLGDALNSSMGLARKVDGYINATEPFKVAKDEARRDELGAILYHCVEALRVASLGLFAAMPDKIGEMWSRMGFEPGAKPFDELARWGVLSPGTPIVKGEALFPRADPKADIPAPIAHEGE
ncbi:MAG: methionine--tRNA ligase [Phycisphaeraceae bacterium]|nr:methionine--tRNA ligase [Phycisphaeraceae bacterium]